MSYANGTQFYNLPQTVGTDKRDWFDTNSAFAAIDAALHSAVTGQASDAEAIATINGKLATDEADIAALQTKGNTHDTQIAALQTTVNSQTTQIQDVRQDAEDMITANNEGAAATSTRAYAVGDYFIYNDVLYKATAAIAIGDTIVPNTNCEATNVDTELTQINSNLTNVTPITLNTGYTLGHVQACKKNDIAYISFSLQTHIDSATSTGPLTIILSGMPKPLLNNSGDNSLYVPAAIYTNGNRELATSLIIDINGEASFIVTQEMKDVVTEVGTAIDVQIIVNTTYLIDNN